MADTKQISDALAALRVEAGLILLKAHRGQTLLPGEQSRLTQIVATLDGLHYAAHALLDEDDWKQFLYRSGCPEAEALESTTKVISDLKLL